MRLTIQQFILYALFGLLAYQAAQARGTESGGGGTTVVKDGQRILLDYFVLDLSFQDQNEFQNYRQFIFSPEFLEKFKNKTFNSNFSDFGEYQSSRTQVDQEKHSEFFNSDPFRLALKIFKEWSDDNLFNLMTDTALYGLFYPVTWFIDDQAIAGPTASIENFKNLNLLDPQLTAYYLDSKGKYLIRISSKTWNELGLLSQAGLLIHEGMRHFQISSGHLEFYFDDSILQKATAMVMLCKPRPTLSMYLNFILNNKEKQAEILPQFGSFADVVRKYCQKRDFKVAYEN